MELHDLNIIDKHQLLIPAFEFMVFDGIRLEDDKKAIIAVPPIYTDESGSFRIAQADNRNVTVKDKGHAALAIVFGVQAPFVKNKPIIPTLDRIAEEVLQTINKCDSAIF